MASEIITTRAYSVDEFEQLGEIIGFATEDYIEARLPSGKYLQIWCP